MTSDAHEGLKEAIRTVLVGATWQRCRVHFMRNLLAQVPKSAQPMVAALVRTIFAQPDKASAHAQLATVAANLAGRFPKAAQLLLEAEEDILAYLAFPAEHRRQLHSTNPLERLNREIGRRTDVVGIFPDRAAVIRLAAPSSKSSTMNGPPLLDGTLAKIDEQAVSFRRRNTAIFGAVDTQFRVTGLHDAGTRFTPLDGT